MKKKGRVKKISVKRSDTWPTVHNTLEATLGDLYSGMEMPTILPRLLIKDLEVMPSYAEEDLSIRWRNRRPYLLAGVYKVFKLLESMTV